MKKLDNLVIRNERDIEFNIFEVIAEGLCHSSQGFTDIISGDNFISNAYIETNYGVLNHLAIMISYIIKRNDF